MTQVQVDLNEEENRKVEIYNAMYGLKDKRLAIKKIIKELKIKEVLK